MADDMKGEETTATAGESTGVVADVRAEALAALDAAADADGLAAWRHAYLGKDGKASALVKRIGALPAEERPAFGAAVNQVKDALEAAFADRRDALRRAELASNLAGEAIDVTLPGTPPPRGRLHPVTLGMRRIVAIFADMGFQVWLSREVETDDLNFGLLNMPPHHPARDMQDTFYVNGAGDLVLRTHTSPGQIHAMRATAPEPLRIVLPGMVYRNEQITPRHEIQLTQLEGLAVGPGITMADLKGTIMEFAKRYYGPERAWRFRASYFPFTEPSAEVDVQCGLCGGAGCRLCKHSGWLEIMGCGMVHPVVLANGGYDPDEVSGFAFGIGTMRGQMLARGIDDIRHYWANDLRFLEQFDDA